MKLQNLDINEKFDINFLCYLFLKVMNSTGGLNDSQINQLLELSYRHSNKDLDNIIRIYRDFAETIKKAESKEKILELMARLDSPITLKLFNFCLKLMPLKNLLLAEAKLITTTRTQQLAECHKLSLEYDTSSTHGAYYVRVNGALIALLLFEKLDSNQLDFVSPTTTGFIEELKTDYDQLKAQGLEPNQIFMLVFTESVNQSIITGGGSSYEERLTEVLVSIGLERSQIKKVHDSSDASTEFDMFFTVDARTYGIGAKRTLRERYKQFIKTAHMTKLDVMIEVTLGIDLTVGKAQAIRSHDVYLFIADEVYNNRDDLQQISGVYPASQLTLETLQTL